MASDTERDRAQQRAAEYERDGDALPGPIRGIRIGRVSGIEIVADWSLLIIFTLVIFGLGFQVLPRWHADWSPGLSWLVAFVAAVAFFGSIVAHELSHALVGRRYGIPVRRITLFLFGGMAHLEDRPPTPKAEILMAGVGPIVSFVIGVVATVAAFSLAGLALGEIESASPETLSQFGPVETILLWLGPINIALAVFNLVPGFPLDGGRVLRAIVWSITGDLRKATRIATGGGRLVAIGLMTIGAAMAFGIHVPFFGAGLGGGLWLMLIGWFLYKAAQASWGQLLISEALRGVEVRDVMRLDLVAVPPTLTLDELASEHVLRSDQGSFPVKDGDQLLGVVSADVLSRTPRTAWPTTRVDRVMTPVGELPTSPASASAATALRRLGAADRPLFVTDDGRFVGLLRRQDLFKWLSIQTDAPA